MISLKPLSHSSTGSGGMRARCFFWCRLLGTGFHLPSSLDGAQRQLPAGLQILALEVAVDGDGRFPARGHRGDGDPGAGLHVAAGKDAFPAGGLGLRVGLDEAPGGELDAVGLGDELQVGLLADGHDDHVGVLGLGLIFKIGGGEAALLVEDPLHRLQSRCR